MPKFKQFNNINIVTKRSHTLGNCFTVGDNEGLFANCSDHQYSNQTDCVNASETWTASFTSVTCKALVPYDPQVSHYKWVGDKYNDFNSGLNAVVIIDLEKVKSYESKYDKLTGGTLAAYTHIVTDSGEYVVNKTLEEIMGIMAVEVK